MLSRLCERCVLSSSFVVCAQHTILKHLPLLRKLWKICDQSFVFLSNTNSASTSAAASTSCRLPNKKRLVTTRSDRRLPCEVSFYKIHPRLGCPGENDLEIVLLCFGKYHAWGVCELQSSEMIPLHMCLRKMWPRAVQ